MRLFLERLERRTLLTTLRIASWNTANNPDDATDSAAYSTVLEAIGTETRNGFVGRVNLLAVQETDLPGSGMDSIGRLEAVFESLYPGIEYGRVVTSLDGGGDATGFVFDETALQLLGTSELSSGFTHNTLRAEFRPVGTSGDADFVIYTTHLKAGTSGSDESRRLNEANLIRADLDAFGAGTQAIVAGDFNIQSSNDASYAAFLSAGAGQLFDPIDTPGNWHNNDSFRSIHTQNPNASGGGMDDRFDFQIVTGSMTDGIGIDYRPDSYRAFGNNGTHVLNGDISSGTGASASVLTALEQASDHLPVVADYNVFANSASVVIAESGGGTSVIEGGTFDTYGISLNTAPAAAVSVTVDPDDQTDIGMGPGGSRTLMFDASNFDVPQTIIVNAVDDASAEGTHTSIITHDAVSSDAEFDGVAIRDVIVTVLDDDVPSILINELDADTDGVDMLEFVELYDGGVGGSDLSGLSVVFFNGSSDASYEAFDLDGFSTDSDGFFVLGNAAVSPDITFPDNGLQNGADAVALYFADAADFPNGTPITTSGLLDALVYDTNDSDDSGLLALLPAGQPQINEGENGNRAFEAIARVPDGGTPLSTSSFQVQSPTPGALNSTPTASVIVAPTGGSTDLSEDGQTDLYSIALSLLPTSDVTISVMPDNQIDLGAGAGVPVSLTFTTTDGTIPQQLTVAAVDDSDIEGPHVGVIAHTASSDDPRFDGLTIPDVVASIADNETIPIPEVVISEIMYNPDSDEASPGVAEWVELANIGSTTVDLSSWRLDDEDSTNWGPIPDGTELQPNEIIVLFDEDFLTGAEFRTSWSVPVSAQVVGVTWGSLANSPSSTSEILTLLDATTTVQDEVNYDDSGDWPSDSPDGASIYLTDLNSDNNVGTNWARSVAGVADARNPVSPFSGVDEGSPGAAPIVNQPDGDFDDDGDLDCDDIDALVLEAASGNNASEFDLTGDGIVDRADVDDWILNRKGTLIGDANLDFQVDISDFNIWNVNKFLPGTGWCGANFNADFGTDISDFNIWNVNKFTSAMLAPPLTIYEVAASSPAQNRPSLVFFETDDTESPEPWRW